MNTSNAENDGKFPSLKRDADGGYQLPSTPAIHFHTGYQFGLTAARELTLPGSPERAAIDAMHRDEEAILERLVAEHTRPFRRLDGLVSFLWFLWSHPSFLLIIVIGLLSFVVWMADLLTRL